MQRLTRTLHSWDLHNYGMFSIMVSTNNMNMQLQAPMQMPMQGMATSMGFAGGMAMSGM
jgi:hypothetical protein